QHLPTVKSGLPPANSRGKQLSLTRKITDGNLVMRTGRFPARLGGTHSMPDQAKPKVTQAEAEAAVRTLIEWAGDDPDREGLLDTPGRVVRAYRELFAGYEADPRQYLERTFEEVGGYDELVVL